MSPYRIMGWSIAAILASIAVGSLSLAICFVYAMVKGVMW